MYIDSHHMSLRGLRVTYTKHREMIFKFLESLTVSTMYHVFIKVIEKSFRYKHNINIVLQWPFKSHLWVMKTSTSGNVFYFLDYTLLKLFYWKCKYFYIMYCYSPFNFHKVFATPKLLILFWSTSKYEYILNFFNKMFATFFCHIW